MLHIFLSSLFETVSEIRDLMKLVQGTFCSRGNSKQGRKRLMSRVVIWNPCYAVVVKGIFCSKRKKGQLIMESCVPYRLIWKQFFDSCNFHLRPSLYKWLFRSVRYTFASSKIHAKSKGVTDGPTLESTLGREWKFQLSKLIIVDPKKPLDF